MNTQITNFRLIYFMIGLTIGVTSTQVVYQSNRFWKAQKEAQYNLARTSFIRGCISAKQDSDTNCRTKLAQHSQDVKDIIFSNVGENQ